MATACRKSGAAATLLIIMIAAGRGGFSPQRMLLAGMALSTAFTMLLMMLQASGDPRMAEVLTWISGSTYNATGGQVTRTAIVMVILLAIVPLCRRWLTILPLGGDAARAVGMALTPSRIALLALAACLTATATMTIGPLSFVGLMAPHIARMLGFRRTMPHMVISALAGAFYWSLPTGAAGWRYFRIRSRRGCFQALLARRTLFICYVNRAANKKAGWRLTPYPAYNTSSRLYSVANTRRAASMVLSMSSMLCATDIKPASNADGARYTPSSSIRWKKRLKRSTSHAITS